ncbi:hypothetical protein F0562_023652 [Nyssa sinensis]|uniref:Uncharacterized protein n=1 Tax=Nyssa sinensis TaxID=561372 RepID=A0A5J5BJR5_9ASTE|nr:hypothetical protein F0562_023652 [Nyssa sinensis]
MSDWNSYTARVVWDRLAQIFDDKPKPEIQSQKVKKTKTGISVKLEDLPNHPSGGDLQKGVQIIKGKIMLGAMGAGLDGLEDESADRVNNGKEYDELDMISSGKEEVAKNNWIFNDVEANSDAESFVDESVDLLRIENISMGSMKEQVEINPIIVPWIKDIRYTKLMHHEAPKLMKYLCNQAKEEDVELPKLPLLFGAQHGIHEVVKEILNLYEREDIFEIVNEENHNAFHLAVMYHREKVFNILYQYVQYLPTHVQKVPFTSHRDQNGNNVLHLAGNLARQDRLDLVSGGVLQMQRDLQWFKVINFFSVSKKVT